MSRQEKRRILSTLALFGLHLAATTAILVLAEYAGRGGMPSWLAGLIVVGVYACGIAVALLEGDHRG